MAKSNRGSSIIAVHSFRRGAGKSTLAANVAALLALGGRRVGIIDIHLAAPSMHVFFNVSSGAGTHTVDDFLLGDCTLEEVAVDVTDSLPLGAPGRLYLLPASDHPSQIARVMRRPYDIARLNAGLQS